MAASNQPQGTFSYENWHAHSRGESAGGAVEFPLFTDAQLLSEVVAGMGPYQVLNTVVHAGRQPGPSAILRVEWCLRFEESPMDRTDYRRYHGGLLHDEIAALLSLELGIRLKAGGATRQFERDGDPRGRPYSYKLLGEEDPYLERLESDFVIPSLVGERRLDAIPLTKRYPELTPEQSIAVVRAARLYQDAVWIADREPQLAWLLLVSAVEVAAAFWRSASEDPLERLAASQADVVELVREHGCEKLLPPLAEILAKYLGATRKFVDFLLRHLPPPPPIRPWPSIQLSWSAEGLRRPLGRVYGYRSEALHAGTPFPRPLCRPPMYFEGAPEEKPIGTASGSRGAVWSSKDLPMLLHVFEYLARSALTSWCEGMLSDFPEPSDHAAA